MSAHPLTVAVYSLELVRYACARVRFLDPARALGGRLRLVWGAKSDGQNYALDSRAMDEADVVAFQRCFPMRETWPLVERALSSGKPVVYDVDDHFEALPDGHPLAQRMTPMLPYCRELARRARAICVSTQELAKAFSDVPGRVAVAPNLIDERIFTAPRRTRDDPSRPVRIVYAGSPTHMADLDMIAPALTRIVEQFGDAVELYFFGCAPRDPILAARSRQLDFFDDYTAYARKLVELAPDIGLAPLRDTPFNRAKSNIKALEYGALGVAGVYSDLPPYQNPDGGPGAFGPLVGPDPGVWEKTIARLVTDAKLRGKIAARARGLAVAEYGLSRHAQVYLDFYAGVARGR
ncbi:glycosyltransferase family 4 protein [Desulfovibrio sulfodismutans]|uniref:Glycosyltransferase family 4 protein n=1 Tax=Desulfolutivibrio sulfodismutans TaxID=63561 RepID=A0A7K3NPF1_9BACT|nr:glycosyltransferase family 4 protein [Desulfolutivibrio sulfodismutans]NDY57685.1 glycosyltransferase family 4 protein [Desulfolutivibrio sulfodismutans]QLA12264.1 glycosyl transferase family 1 [Desulfolutivibrio sulfodismutans DSM 3696]